jgi:hypothetical protein
MPVYREREYHFEPVCIFCGKPTDRTILLGDLTRTRFSHKPAVEVPAHPGCPFRRLMTAFWGAILGLLLFAGGVTSIISRIDALAAAIWLLVVVLVVMPGGGYLLMKWVEAPRRRFLRTHGFEE